MAILLVVVVWVADFAMSVVLLRAAVAVVNRRAQRVVVPEPSYPEALMLMMKSWFLFAFIAGVQWYCLLLAYPGGGPPRDRAFWISSAVVLLIELELLSSLVMQSWRINHLQARSVAGLCILFEMIVVVLCSAIFWITL